MSDPDAVYKGADIIAGCTDSAVDIIRGAAIEEGTHITSIGGRPDAETFDRIHVSLRLGTSPAPGASRNSACLTSTLPTRLVRTTIADSR